MAASRFAHRFTFFLSSNRKARSASRETFIRNDCTCPLARWSATAFTPHGKSVDSRILLLWLRLGAVQKMLMRQRQDYQYRPEDAVGLGLVAPASPLFQTREK